jgi:phosphoglucosamine mutase
VKLQKNWHVVVDPGCGAACNISPFVLKKLGCKLTVLNSQPDGFFPARSPEPSSKSLQNLMKTVKKLNADVGVAYDGDADRVSFIDQGGNFADFDSTLAAYAASVVKKERGRVVVTNVEASMCVDAMVKRAGGKVVRTKVGDVYIAEEIVKNKAVLGGEPCGAWIHPQAHLCPDGILSSVLQLKALEEEGQTLAEFIAEVPRYYTLRENISCRNSVKNEIVEKVGESLKTAFPNHSEFLDIDGVRLSFPKWWILVRASGTEPLIRITVEGESRKISTETIRAGTTLVKKHIQESSE